MKTFLVSELFPKSQVSWEKKNATKFKKYTDTPLKDTGTQSSCAKNIGMQKKKFEKINVFSLSLFSECLHETTNTKYYFHQLVDVTAQIVKCVTVTMKTHMWLSVINFIIIHSRP